MHKTRLPPLRLLFLLPTTRVAVYICGPIMGSAPMVAEICLSCYRLARFSKHFAKCVPENSET